MGMTIPGCMYHYQVCNVQNDIWRGPARRSVPAPARTLYKRREDGDDFGR
jgi:hypothetical protein